MKRTVTIASAAPLSEGQGTAVEVEGRRIAVFNVGGVFFAIDDTCPHRGGPLSEGAISGRTVTCPWHSADFDLETGKVLAPPARTGVTTYPIRVKGTEIEIDLPE
jgi:nitrite reductase/ring-hydroxylating ferredoxin subunit